MNLTNSYFAIPNPLLLFDRWFNGYSHQRFVHLQGKRIEVTWTKRAEQALKRTGLPLIVEMQLYFSCVIKKRVVFHRQADFETTAVNDQIRLVYRPVQSAVCNPETFARDYPEGRELDSMAARKMQPSKLNIDFRQGQWQGEMRYGE